MVPLSEHSRNITPKIDPHPSGEIKLRSVIIMLFCFFGYLSYHALIL